MSTILVVDDDDAFRDSIIDVLEDEGHEVTGTCDPFAALKRLMTHDFDLIITDMLMPDQDGAYLIKQLRQLNIRSKIIAMSGGGKLTAAESDVDWAGDLEADGTLHKPFSAETLRHMIAKLNLM